MNRLFSACLYLLLALSSNVGSRAAAPGFGPEWEASFKQFCFDCHGDKKVKGDINLQKMAATPEFANSFKAWEKIIEMLETKEMPPDTKPQPTEAQRKEMVDSIQAALNQFVQKQAGDPGRIAMRRMTSAEYGYSIQDLTGLELGLEKTFVSDAVGGEGFSNVGDVQFIQDSMLERYLEAAKIVASHAVVGAGPLHFSRDPGKTGQELAAIAQIQKIYRAHGFRTAAGEGGMAYGLDLYAKAFYAAWRLEHRAGLILTVAQAAHEEGVDARFVEHLWNALKLDSFPSRDIAAAWRALPDDPARARAECEKLYKTLQDWQLTLAENAGNAEDAPILTETSFKPSLSKSFQIRLAWPAGMTNASFEISVSPVAADGKKPVVVWAKPGLRFRQRPGGAAAAVSTGARVRPEAKPLREFVTLETAERLQFGIGPSQISTNEFVTTGAAILPISFSIPAGMTLAELILEARLDVDHGDDCIVRCVVSHQLNEGATAAASGTFSVLLANPDGTEIDHLKAGVVEFARNFPQISHREPNPADRDPIPEPFDNDYNNAERNEFHAFVKYHRDDRFLTDHILDDSTRMELDQAWTDLLTSFDYHDTFLRFVAKKYRIDLGDKNSATVDVGSLSEEARPYVKWMREDYFTKQKTLEAAHDGHLADVLVFAQRAWRRPLQSAEKARLQSFYTNLREQKVEHAEAVRSLLTRILVAPSFLYRTESPSTAAAENSSPWTPLSDWELANRLSFFLWSSIPDEELTRAAEAGELNTPRQLAAQARRMLRDPKARRFATEFFGQWFGFYRFDAYRGVDTSRFPEFTDKLKADLYDEAVSFFDFIVREDRPAREILFADYAFLNRNLAAHYEVEAANLSTNKPGKVDGVNQFHRGGLLRLGAPLITTSAPLRTSGVKRGDWILRRVLGKAIPPPPGDAGSIPPDDVLADGKTVRQRLEAHRTDESCVNCHARIDPLGFALEHFDSLGRWRDTYRDGQKIDASGTLSDGTEIVELEGLLEYLQKNEASFNRTLCAKLLGYALGRGEIISDRPLLEQMTAGMEKDSSFSSLVAQIVSSTQFRFQRASQIDGSQKQASASR